VIYRGISPGAVSEIETILVKLCPPTRKLIANRYLYMVRSRSAAILSIEFFFSPLLGCLLVLFPATDRVLNPSTILFPRDRFLFAIMGPVLERLALEG
jgi:hypothetical protein